MHYFLSLRTLPQPLQQVWGPVGNQLGFGGADGLHVTSRGAGNNNKPALGRQGLAVDVQGCAISQRKEATMVKCCIAPGCLGRQERDNVSFYRFPLENGRNLTEKHKAI